ncbi:MAG: DUF3822 family protein, partial [Polaribacter sp.]
MKIKNNTSLLQNVNKKLSIQFNLGGFSFCISDISAQKDLFFKNYSFTKKEKTPEDLLIKIEEIFKTDTHLQDEFSEIVVIHQNSLSTLVPNSYFDKDKLNSYLEYNIKTFSTDFITFDDLPIINAKNVYIPYVNINNYIFQNFGEFTYKHYSSVLIDKLISKTKTTKKTMYVNVSDTNFDIVILEN